MSEMKLLIPRLVWLNQVDLNNIRRALNQAQPRRGRDRSLDKTARKIQRAIGHWR